MKNSESVNETKAALVISQLDLAFRREACQAWLEGKSLSFSLEDWMAEKRPEVISLLSQFRPEEEIDRCIQKKIELISITDPGYPEKLAAIPDPPLVLYARGQGAMVHDPSVAIVGSRQASFYGEEQARRFARVLADSGLTIVSGLALGIDQAAHEAALEGGGRTVAVLGCGMDVIYPAENRKLFERIAAEGLILSEYPLGAEPRAYHFPRRNRILSGLALGVFVVEAHEKSGSLITAYQALEQGREVFALPGPVQHITSRGTHRLIREGATLVEAPEEIIEHFSEVFGALKKREEEWQGEFPRFSAGLASKVLSQNENESENEFQRKIVEALKKQNCDYEALFECSQMQPQEFAQALTGLEIEGKVRKNQYGFYEMC